MKNIKNLDKLYHLIAGIIFGFINLYLGIFIGIGKEIYDNFIPRHTCDIKDLIATVIGAFIGFGIRRLI